MNNIIFGSTGRIGSLILSNQLLKGRCYISLRDNFFFESGRTLSLDNLINEIKNEEIRFIDMSVDYTDVDLMKKHELEKRTFFEALLEKCNINCYVGMSSGAAQFSTDLISNDFYLEYSKLKCEQAAYLSKFDFPFFFPQLFTLIGKHSYSCKTLGWVSILEKLINNKEIELFDPHEMRTWVSEFTLVSFMRDFINAPKGRHTSAIMDGNFSLYSLVNCASQILNKNVAVKITSEKSKKWLKVPYVNQIETDMRGCLSLENVIAPILELQT